MEPRFENKPHPPVWEHLVDDWLEIACSVTKASRDFLRRMLRLRQVSAESIQRHPSFTIGRLVVVVREDGDTEECWFFDPKLKRIRKFLRETGKS
jgi:hypothetical protein